MAQCAYCRDEVRKRDIVCVDHWKGLPMVRKTAVRMAPYSRDDIGKKFLNELLTCDETILRSMIAENQVKLERYGEMSKNVKFLIAAEKEAQKELEAMEIV